MKWRSLRDLSIKGRTCLNTQYSTSLPSFIGKMTIATGESLIHGGMQRILTQSCLYNHSKFDAFI